MYNNKIKWAFEKDQKFSQLTKIQVEKIIINMQHSVIKENHSIISVNEPWNKIVVVLEGSLRDVIYIEDVNNNKIGII